MNGTCATVKRATSNICCSHDGMLSSLQDSGVVMVGKEEFGFSEDLSCSEFFAVVLVSPF